jgi:hypothetical protein
MAGTDQDLAQLKQRAEAIGLTCLTDAHLAQLQRAAAAIGKRKALLTMPLSVADEPAHVFSLKAEA